MALQSELTSTEDRIASARRYYNANVRELNTKVETIPTSFIAGMAGVTKAEYFETGESERQAPQVSFGTPTSTLRRLPPPRSAPATPAPAPAPGPQDAAASGPAVPSAVTLPP